MMPPWYMAFWAHTQCIYDGKMHHFIIASFIQILHFCFFFYLFLVGLENAYAQVRSVNAIMRQIGDEARCIHTSRRVASTIVLIAAMHLCAQQQMIAPDHVYPMYYELSFACAEC